MERTNLKLFRVQHKLSQQQMADKMGIARGTYSSVESGKRDGRQFFWQSLQDTFLLPDDELWGLMKKDEQ